MLSSKKNHLTEWISGYYLRLSEHNLFLPSILSLRHSSRDEKITELVDPSPLRSSTSVTLTVESSGEESG